MRKRGLACALLLLTLYLNPACLAQTAAPTQTLNVAGLRERVIVQRDARGVPYITARSEADLYFAQGYATAGDRLWQMDLYRRVARGETAEIFGRVTFEEDKRWRKLGFAGIAEQTLPLLAPEVRASLESYARGVNAYLAALDDKSLPLECQTLQYRPREWTPADSIVIGKILADGLSNTWQFDLQRASLDKIPINKRRVLLDDTSPLDVLLIGSDPAVKDPRIKAATTSATSGTLKQKHLKLSVPSVSSVAKLLAEAESVRRRSLERIGFYAEGLAASNNWVISGKRTASGKPILANDPHLQATTPPIWHLVHLTAPNLKVAGVTLPGAPGVILGHNAEVAWGATNVGPDVQDLYLESFDPKNARRYKTPTGFADAVVRREEIRVRKSPFATATDQEGFNVVETRNGVVYFENGSQQYALNWTARDPRNNELETFYYLNRVRNWNEFQTGLKRYGGSMQNFVYADRAGNIGWYAAGRVPIRRTGDGSRPYNGATDAGEWTGFVPFEELPNLYNPPSGLIVTANQRVVGKNYKHQQIVRDYAAPFRARHIHDVLNFNPNITVENVRDLQRDTIDLSLERFARAVVETKAATAPTLQLLRGWNGRMDSDSKAALVASEMLEAFRRRIIAANLPIELQGQIYAVNYEQFLDRLMEYQPREFLPKRVESYAELWRACERDARARLIEKLGADEARWTWGATGSIDLPHPLASIPLIGSQFAIPSLPRNGSRNAVNVGEAVSMRLIATPGDWDETLQGLPTGESGDSRSPHYKDQFDDWAAGETQRFPFSEAAVKKAARETIALVPQK